jgi:hypothetical protein
MIVLDTALVVAAGKTKEILGDEKFLRKKTGAGEALISKILGSFFRDLQVSNSSMEISEVYRWKVRLARGGLLFRQGLT